MIQVLLILLIILWFLGYINVSVPLPVLNIILFTINGHNVTLLNLLVLFIIAWAIGILPSPFREIASVFLVLWILSILGILAIAGLSNILLIAIIAGLVAYLISGSK